MRGRVATGTTRDGAWSSLGVTRLDLNDTAETLVGRRQCTDRQSMWQCIGQDSSGAPRPHGRGWNDGSSARAASTIGLAQDGASASGSSSRMRPSFTRITRHGDGGKAVVGSCSIELSQSTSSCRSGIRVTRFSRLRRHRSRIRASGMSCPPCATRVRTRARCRSTESRRRRARGPRVRSPQPAGAAG